MALKAPYSASRVVIAIACAALVVIAGFSFVKESAPIKVGILHSRTGPMAISENSMVDAELLAIDEINARGGLLGRKIEPVIADGKSDWPTFAKEAERLITQENVFGDLRMLDLREPEDRHARHREIRPVDGLSDGL